MAGRSPANRILLDRKYGSSARGLIKDLLGQDSSPLFTSEDERSRVVHALATHGINSEALKAIEEDDLPTFIAAREEQLRKQEDGFLGAFGLSIEGKVERSDEEVDVDED